MARVAVVALILVAAPACFDASFGDNSFTCQTTQLCPTGFACIEGRCVAGPIEDAAPPDLDAPPGLDAGDDAVSACRNLPEGSSSGAYSIAPTREPARPMFCDMETDGGGWTVLVNNIELDEEPEGCVPRVASHPSLVCGQPQLDADHAALATGVEFTELLWLAIDDNGANSAYRYFRWNDAQSIPAEMLWSLTPDGNSSELASLQPLPLIECNLLSSGPSGLRRIANETPAGPEGGWAENDVVTFFDQNAIEGDNGRMSLTGADAASDDLGGVDDFQDGRGCSDMWSPKTIRGDGSRIMIR